MEVRRIVVPEHRASHDVAMRHHDPLVPGNAGPSFAQRGKSVKNAHLSAIAAALAVAATSAFGGECCQGGGHGHGYAAETSAGYGPLGYGSAGQPTLSGYGLPGGYENRIGNPYHYTPGHAPVLSKGTYGLGPVRGGGHGYGAGAVGGGGDVYSTHFGPGFHRSSQSGHYRFPYYSYRRPWYHVGPPAYAADTNLPW